MLKLHHSFIFIWSKH